MARKRASKPKHPTASGSDVVWEPLTGSLEKVVELRIAMPRQILASALARVMPQFRERFPRVRLHIEERDASAAAAVAAGSSEVAVYAGTDRDPRLTYQLLPGVPMLVASPKKHRWNGNRISARALARQPLIVYPPSTPLRARMDAWFEKAEVAPQDIVMTVRDTESVLRYVGLGLGHAIVPRLGLRTSEDYVLHPGSPAIEHYEPVIVYNPGKQGLPPATAALILMLEEVWPALTRVWHRKKK